MNSRRELMKLLGLAPAAPIAAAAALKEAMASPAVATAAAVLSTSRSAGFEMPSSPGLTRFGEKLFRHLGTLRQLSEDERNARRHMRDSGFDNDIAAMRSTSMAFKVSKQLDRDREENQFFAATARQLWG